jgi:hypothetical protein
VLADDYKIDVADYPKEIMIEVGWLKYFNIVLKNNGDLKLDNVSVSFDGESPQWFEVQNNNLDVLQPNNNASFLVKLNIPSNTESKSYSFILFAKSKEITDSRAFSVRIFNTEADMLLYQVDQLEIEIEDIERNATKVEESGKNVTEVKNTLDQAKEYAASSKDYINRGDYEKVTELIIELGKLIKEASFDLSIASPNKGTTSSSNDSMSLIVLINVIGIIAIAIILILLKRSKKENIIKTPIVKIKEIVMEGKDVKNLENELKGIENSRNLLEEEFKENLISKESYDELKTKYERLMEEISAKIERNRKIV